MFFTLFGRAIAWLATVLGTFAVIAGYESTLTKQIQQLQKC